MIRTSVYTETRPTATQNPSRPAGSYTATVWEMSVYTWKCVNGVPTLDSSSTTYSGSKAITGPEGATVGNLGGVASTPGDTGGTYEGIVTGSNGEPGPRLENSPALSYSTVC